jgi:hypothetical protein
VSDNAPPAPVRWLSRARELPEALATRTAARRAAILERRVGALTPELERSQAGVDEPDMDVTMRAGWELIKSLRAALLSLEERATRLVPALVAGVVALWTQLGSFDAGAAEILAWIAWTLLIVALLNLGVLVMPKRLAQFWDGLVPPEVVLAKPRPLRRHEEAAIASRLSAELHAQTERLRSGFRLTVALSSCGLVLAAFAYVIEKW